MTIKEVRCASFTLVDTMGINAPDFPDHKVETFQEIKKADVVLMVMKAISPFTDGEQDICTELRNFEPPVVIAVTYIDALKSEQRRAECHERVAETLQAVFGNEAEGTIFYLDAADAEEKILNGASYSDPSFAALNAFIGTKLSDKVFIKLRNAASKANKAAENGIIAVRGTLKEEQKEYHSRLDSLSSKEEKTTNDNTLSIIMRRHELQVKEDAHQRAIEDSARWQKGNEEHIKDLRREVNCVAEKVDQADSKSTSWTVGSGLTGVAMGATVAGPWGALFGGITGVLVDAFTKTESPKLEWQREQKKDLSLRLRDAKKEKAEIKLAYKACIEECRKEMIIAKNHLSYEEAAHKRAKDSINKDRSNLKAKMEENEKASEAKIGALRKTMEEICRLQKDMKGLGRSL